MPKKASHQKIIAPPSVLYRRIGFSFIAATIMLLALVSYFSFAHVTIIVKPKREAISAPFVVTVRGTPNEHELRGIVIEKMTSGTRTFPVKDGTGTPTPVPATGRVTIKNTTSRDQALVRTTRLLAPGNILFHIARSVRVPAHGLVDVEMYADVPGKSGEIPPTRFTIPGLHAALQDKIYAVSTAATCCGTKLAAMITEDVLAAARTELQNALLEDTKTTLTSTTPGAADLAGVAIASTIVEQKSDVASGATASKFTISLKLKATVVFYDATALADRSHGALTELAGSERELVSVDPSRLEVAIDQYDEATHTARLAVTAHGLTQLRPASSVFDKDRLVGLDRAAIETYVKSWNSVESVQVEFHPAWLRHVPRLKDHIEIKIEN